MKNYNAIIAPGVVNIITGYGPKAGEALSRHMKVSKIAFTGSLATGRAIMKAAAETNLKKITLELGGKSPSIIFDDVESVDEVVFWAHTGIFFNSGQSCCAGILINNRRLSKKKLTVMQKRSVLII